jgi:hypothetical protein
MADFTEAMREVNEVGDNLRIHIDTLDMYVGMIYEVADQLTTLSVKTYVKQVTDFHRERLDLESLQSLLELVKVAVDKESLAYELPDE